MPVSLSVHRNTKARREAKRVRHQLVKQAKMVACLPGVAGYAIVAWNRNWDHKTSWDSNTTMPGNTMPEFVKVALLRDVARDDLLAILESPLDDGA